MTVFPNAKINIGLNVISRREDGYHNIETVFVPVALTDILEININPSTTNSYEFISNGIAIDSEPNNNLIIKAFSLLAKDYTIPQIKICLTKRIPFGAGLGGGSADAAFTLTCLRDLLKLEITDEQLEQYAAKLGADCPVFIKNKMAFATGTGNIFSSLNISLQGFYLLIVKPDINISTPKAYSMLTPQKPVYPLINSIRQPIEQWKKLITNDFETPVFSLFPEIAKIKSEMYENGALYTSMSGSGSAVYGIYPTKNIDTKAFNKYFTAIVPL